MNNKPLRSISQSWSKISPAWQTSMIVFLAGRILYTIWSLAILYIFPTVVTNSIVYGKPALLAFDLRMEKGYVYSRSIDGNELIFKYFSPGQVTDTATHSIWSLERGTAIEGRYAGHSLAETQYPVYKAFGVQPQSPLPFSLWQRYDTNWYLKIAQAGYDVNDGSMAFLPLYPLLIRLLGWLLGDALLAALLISNIALFFGLYFLYNLTSEFMDQSSAKRALVYYVIFPTSFFLFAAYTESLFLLFVLTAFHAARKQRWILAGILGGMAAITRVQGVVLFFPLILMWYRLEWKKQPKLWRALPLLLIPLAFLSYQFYTEGKYAASLQNRWLARTSMPWENFQFAIRSFLDASGNLITLFNMLVAVGFLCMCIPIFKRLPFEYFLYTALVLVMPLFRMNEGEPLVSYGRYALAAIPVFMVLGNWGKKAWVNRLLIYLGFPMAMYFCAIFVMWSWVG